MFLSQSGIVRRETQFELKDSMQLKGQTNRENIMVREGGLEGRQTKGIEKVEDGVRRQGDRSKGS